jgi:hypothetical protein
VRAMEIARRQHTRSFELRAALSLARLYQATGRGEACRELLAPALVGFRPLAPQIGIQGPRKPCRLRPLEIVLNGAARHSKRPISRAPRPS